jgi:cytochrome c peroxidase
MNPMNHLLAKITIAGALILGITATDKFDANGQSTSHSRAVLDDLALEFTDAEIARILQHGPWPPAPRKDPSNRMSGQAKAIAFGKDLFFDSRLSGSGTSSCSTCHVPELRFADAKTRGHGFVELDRNTPGLFNVGLNRWFGWDGAADSLWSQSLRPIVDKREMAASTTHIGRLVRNDAVLSARYRDVFAAPPSRNDDMVTVDVGKALAAFQETLISGRTPFDEFRDSLARGDRQAAARYPAAAQRGLKIFVGRGNCSTCHFGPNFTNGEFADIGIPFFKASGEVDPGRYGGIRKLLESRANLMGAYSDDPKRASAIGTRHLRVEHRNWGEFRVPSLRDVAKTAPYMHNGHLATLPDVVRYYSDLNEDRLHADGEKILRPLRLSDAEVADLVAFLETLTAPDH